MDASHELFCTIYKNHGNILFEKTFSVIWLEIMSFMEYMIRVDVPAERNIKEIIQVKADNYAKPLEWSKLARSLNAILKVIRPEQAQQIRRALLSVGTYADKDKRMQQIFYTYFCKRFFLLTIFHGSWYFQPFLKSVSREGRKVYGRWKVHWRLKVPRSCMVYWWLIELLWQRN